MNKSVYKGEIKMIVSKYRVEDLTISKVWEIYKAVVSECTVGSFDELIKFMREEVMYTLYLCMGGRRDRVKEHANLTGKSNVIYDWTCIIQGCLFGERLMAKNIKSMSNDRGDFVSNTYVIRNDMERFARNMANDDGLTRIYSDTNCNVTFFIRKSNLGVNIKLNAYSSNKYNILSSFKDCLVNTLDDYLSLRYNGKLNWRLQYCVKALFTEIKFSMRAIQSKELGKIYVK